MDDSTRPASMVRAESLHVLPQEQRTKPFRVWAFTYVLDGTLKGLLGLALLGELAIVFFNVLSRWTSGTSLVWTLEGAELALSTIAFVGGAFAYRRGEHAFIHTLVDALPLGYQRACYALIELLVLAVAVTTGLSAIPLLIRQWDEVTPILQIRAGWFVLPLVASMIVLAVTPIERVLAQHRRAVPLSGEGVHRSLPL